MRDKISAFPVESNYAKQVNPGMSLRDYFSGQAMIGFINMYQTEEEGIDNACQRSAELAYKLADAMLEQRGKK